MRAGPGTVLQRWTSLVLALAAAGAGRIAHVHFANPRGRVFPREASEYDYAGLFENLARTSHPGRISVEARTEDLAADGPKAVAFLRQAAASSAVRR